MRTGGPAAPESPIAPSPRLGALSAPHALNARAAAGHLRDGAAIIGAAGSRAVRADVPRAVVAGAVLWLAVGLWIALIPIITPQLSNERPPGPVLDDIGVFYAASRMVRDGRGDELYDLRALEQYEREVYERPYPVLPYFNPPPFAGALLPLTYLPFGTAALIFLALSSSLFALALFALLRESRAGYAGAALIVAMILAFQPVHDMLFHGQLSFLLLFAFTSCFLCLASGRDRLAGAALGLLIIKPNLLLLPLALLVWKRRTGALTGFGAVAGVWVAASVAISGLAVLWEYPAFLREATGWDDQNGITIRAMFGWNALVRVHTVQMYAVNAWTIALSIPTAIAALWSWRGPWPSTRRDLALRYSALVMAAMLINPHLYRQDVIVIAIPALLLLGATAGRARAVTGIALACGWLIFLYHFPLLRELDFNVTVAAMAIMLAAIAAMAARHSASGERTTVEDGAAPMAAPDIAEAAG